MEKKISCGQLPTFYILVAIGGIGGYMLGNEIGNGNIVMRILCTALGGFILAVIAVTEPFCYDEDGNPVADNKKEKGSIDTILTISKKTNCVLGSFIN